MTRCTGRHDLATRCDLDAGHTGPHRAVVVWRDARTGVVDWLERERSERLR